jgi:hypothetical protein
MTTTTPTKKGPEPWEIAAAKQVNVSKRHEDREWRSWVSRQPESFRMGTNSSDRRYWSRGQFKAALKHMPKNHPERGLYMAGAAYAPHFSAGDENSATIVLFTLFVFISAALIIDATFIYAVGLAPYIWIPLVAGGILSALYWLRYWFRWLYIFGR